MVWGGEYSKPSSQTPQECYGVGNTAKNINMSTKRYVVQCSKTTLLCIQKRYMVTEFSTRTVPYQ